MLTIRRDIVEETVLAGLNEKLMQPEIMRTMAVLGVTDILSIGREHIMLPNELPVSGTGVGNMDIFGKKPIFLRSGHRNPKT